MKNNTFRAPVLDIIRKRSSIRSFSDTVVTTEVIVSLKSYIESLNAPFNGKVRFEFLSESDELEKLGAKIGTYGIIKGAKNYVAIIGDAKDRKSTRLNSSHLRSPWTSRKPSYA